MDTALPKGFEALAPFAEVWGQLDSQGSRYLQRQSCSLAELRAFYDAVSPRLEEIFDHLDKFPMDALPAPEALLYRTVLGLTEVGQALEVFGQPGVPYAPFPHKMDIEWWEHRQPAAPTEN
jgi:hypothetical protein